jgi:hypothetical protein
MRTFDGILFIGLLVLLFLGLYLMNYNAPNSPMNYSIFSSQPNFTFSSGLQFYPNMRYSDRAISYSIESTCTPSKRTDMVRAFEIVSLSTKLGFYETTLDPEIEILCSEIPPQTAEKDHFIAGEGGPIEIINASSFSLIKKGKVSIFRSEKCEQPNVDIHELLHALGFNHINDKRSIMYPISSCDQRIDAAIIEEINRLYEIESLPDLAIDMINATSKGRYLDFSINVSNVGLKDSKNAVLFLYDSDGAEIKNFSLGVMPVGIRKSLNVENVRVTEESERLTFRIFSMNRTSSEKEISLDNNEAVLVLSREG